MNAIKVFEAKHTLFESVEEMLAPETLGDLLGKPVKHVKCLPVTEHGGVAGSRLSYVDTNAGRLFLKKMSSAFDWIMYATADQQCRSVTLWQYGLLDQLHPHFGHKIIACSREDTTWAILMPDLSQQVFSDHPPMSQEFALIFLDKLAKLHATYWNDPLLYDPRLGLCDPAKWLNLSSRKLAQNHPGDQRGVIPSWIRQGWQLMEKVLDADVFTLLSRLRQNPQPLLELLSRYPFTLIHGDYAARNLAYLDPLPIVFDWQVSGPSLMTIDLIWFADNVLGSIEMDQVFRYYRGRLEGYLNQRFDDGDWQAMVQLGGLVVALVMICFPVYLFTNADGLERHTLFGLEVKRHGQRVRDAMCWL